MTFIWMYNLVHTLHEYPLLAIDLGLSMIQKNRSLLSNKFKLLFRSALSNCVQYDITVSLLQARPIRAYEPSTEIVSVKRITAFLALFTNRGHPLAPFSCYNSTYLLNRHMKQKLHRIHYGAGLLLLCLQPDLEMHSLKIQI